MGVMLYYFNKVSSYKTTENLTLELNNSLLQLRKNEKDFLLQDIFNESFFKTGECKSLTKYVDNHESAESILNIMAESPVINQLDFQDSIKLAKTYLDQYSTSFRKLVEEYKVKGYKDFGHEGTLRQAIHSIEEGGFNVDKVLILTLRRNEKDFLLRKDLKYVEKFDGALAEFVASAESNPDLKLAILKYGKEFHEVVEGEKRIGITLEDGLKKDLREVVHKIEPLLSNLKNKITEDVENVVFWAYVYLVILFIVQLVIGITLALLFANTITESVHVIQDRISKLSNGVFPDKIVPDTQDELGDTSIALNNLVDRVRTAATFAGKIGEGELNIVYDENFANDVLATSLQAMHFKLKETAEDSRKRNWVTVGLANFGEIVRKSDSDLHKLSQEIINNLVKYLGANQGQLYVVRDKTAIQDEYLELMATYAWNKVKFETKAIDKGVGLAGQCWIEQQTIYLTQIPQNYISITSGLGESLPNAILIVPLKVNEEVFGVVELASFKHLEQYQIEFVEKLAEVIASSLASAQINARTKKLLADSQQQAEELRAQEEEMRQNTEEMQATQEEMHRQKEETDRKIRELEAELEAYKNK